MSYVDQGRSVRPASVAAVVAVHIVIGYAVVSGLAYTVFNHGPTITTARLIPADPPPPPPREQALPRTATHPLPQAEPTRIDPVVPIQDKVIEIGQIEADRIQPVQPLQRSDPPPQTSDLGRGATTVGDRAAWVTTTDYPASAARAGAEGTTAIRVTVGADGRASDCRVTASSGNPALDDTACRTYLRRARFRPALDHDGHPIASEHVDRIKWVLPTD